MLELMRQGELKTQSSGVRKQYRQRVKALDKARAKLARAESALSSAQADQWERRRAVRRAEYDLETLTIAIRKEIAREKRR
jgi:hypothetical protein